METGDQLLLHLHSGAKICLLDKRLSGGIHLSHYQSRNARSFASTATPLTGWFVGARDSALLMLYVTWLSVRISTIEWF